MTATGPHPCPVCSRPLTGLAPPNRCPECGFEYDADTRVWRSGETWGRVAVVYTAYGLIVGTIAAAIYRLGSDQAPYPALPLLLALVIPVVGLVLRRVISGRISGRFVALTPRGVLVGTRPISELVPWDDVERLTEQRGVPKLQRRDSENLVAFDDIFTGPEDLAAFRFALEAARRRWAQRPGWPENSISDNARK